ncbi:MAG: FAD:protein FMN transferase [Deltaproteobacteria bacterium]|nr:FAD:protein FMN transferase [Deltaproteobacteria bacterium]
MRSNRYLIYLSVLSLIFIILTAPSFFKEKHINPTFSRIQMGTLVEITFLDDDNETFDNAAEAAFAEIQRLEALMSEYIPESEVSRINSSAGRDAVRVSPEVFAVIEKALEVSRLSEGAFDPTVGALFGKAWNFSDETQNVPAKEELKKLVALVDWRKIILDKGSSSVMLEKQGMGITLGGVAKGYIVGRAVEKLKEKGIKSAMVKAGGDMFVFALRGARPFKIGIQHPRKTGAFAGILKDVSDAAIATSGDYERYFIKDKVRFHHILDPKTGFPAQDSMSVTVVSKDPALADALSTAVFVMGPEKGMALIEQFATEGVEAVIIDSKGNASVSSGLKGKVDIFE